MSPGSDRRTLGAVLGRPLLLLLVSAVAWGTLLLLAFAWSAVTRGVGFASQALLPSTGDPAWAYLNFLAAVLALLGWGAVAAWAWDAHSRD